MWNRKWSRFGVTWQNFRYCVVFLVNWYHIASILHKTKKGYLTKVTLYIYIYIHIYIYMYTCRVTWECLPYLYFSRIWRGKPINLFFPYKSDIFLSLSGQVWLKSHTLLCNFRLIHEGRLLGFMLMIIRFLMILHKIAMLSITWFRYFTGKHKLLRISSKRKKIYTRGQAPTAAGCKTSPHMMTSSNGNIFPRY